MKITNCNCAIKCDASGCGNLAKKEITFKGIETDLRLCGKCYDTIIGKTGERSTISRR